MPNLGTPELIIIAVVVLVLFGSKKLPEAARSVGRSLRILKSETKGLRDDEASLAPAAAPPAIAPAPPAQTANGVASATTEKTL
ncbi:Sec-independent protein translocase subunit TatA [Pseudofrankia sp. DC12]|uniref:Sec-independent protein translocase subunit TatA n=1 Tax=Pseudofrankia sp. DC12 TaxID=683315 RepID=UPI0005F789F3|nr:Sec-independent protein translocase subunit TatA [Pseudofrankia sp. DC12]